MSDEINMGPPESDGQPLRDAGELAARIAEISGIGQWGSPQVVSARFYGDRWGTMLNLKIRLPFKKDMEGGK